MNGTRKRKIIWAVVGALLLLTIGLLAWRYFYFRKIVPANGIAQLSPTHVVVSRARLDAQLANLVDLLQTARAVPYIEPASGKFTGFLMEQIDPTSFFYEIGLREGDILIQLQDKALTHPGVGLELFQDLRTQTSLTVGLLRDGKPLTMQYEISP